MAVREATRKLDAEIHGMRDEGLSVSAIAQRLGVSMWRVWRGDSRHRDFCGLEARGRPDTRADLAALTGYTPGVFHYMRMAEHGDMLQEWVDYLEAGKIPPEFDGMTLDAFKDLLAKELADYMDSDREEADRYYPRRKTIEGPGEGGAFVLKMDTEYADV